MMKKLPGADFIQTEYLISGQGRPVVLLHGFGEDRTIWNKQVAELSRAYTCIVPNLPGTGASPLPGGTCSMESLADAVHAILVHEQLSDVILLGHSMGGYIALAFAEKYPHLLAGLGLIHSTALADEEAKKENRRKSIRLIEREGKDIFLRTMVPNLYAPGAADRIPSDLEFHLAMALALPSETLLAYYRAMIERPDRTQILRSATCPVLFVVGMQDHAVPYRQVLSQVSLPAVSMVELLPDVGHTGMLETPERMNSILNSYCKYVWDSKKP